MVEEVVHPLEEFKQSVEWLMSCGGVCTNCEVEINGMGELWRRLCTLWKS